MTGDSRNAVGWPRWAALGVCAAGSAWLYERVIGLAALMASAQAARTGDALPWVNPGIAAPHGSGAEFIGCCAGLFLLYAWLLWAARGVQSRAFAIAASAMAAGFMALLLCAPVILSSDVYAYAFYGRVLALHGANAHGPDAMLAAAAGDPFLVRGWRDWGPSRYGPLWTLISAALVRMSGGSVGGTLLMFRGLGALSAFACAGLIRAILARLRPHEAVFGTLLFLWNPLVIIESALGGHNDVCMMALALAAVWLHTREERLGAAAALALSAMVKVITGPLLLLYLWTVARGMKSGRVAFLLRAGLICAGIAAITMAGARMRPSGFLAQAAAAPGFYRNNYQELIFRGLRRMLGEPRETLDAPMDFHVWWVAPAHPTDLRLGLSGTAPSLARLDQGHPLLGLSSRDSDDWLRVYDPASRKVGFVEWAGLGNIAAPPGMEQDAVVQRLSVEPALWPTVVLANRLIRIASLCILAGFAALAALRARGTDGFLQWGTAFLLLSILVVFTKLWPWYAVWPLAFAALNPGRAAARLAVWLSAGLAGLYGYVTYCNTRAEWLYDYRSVFVAVAPVAAWAAGEFIVRFRPSRRGEASESRVPRG